MAVSEPKIGTGALTFNGSDEYLSTAYSSDFYASNGYSSIIEFYVAFDSLGSDELVWNQWGTTSYHKGIRIGKNSSNKMYVIRSSNGSNQTTYTTNTAITDNDWHHFAVHTDGSTNTARMYLDGVYVGSYSAGANLPAIARGIFLGANESGGTRLHGALDEVRYVWGATVSGLWTSTVTPYTPPTTAYSSNSNTRLLLHLDANLTDSGNTGHTVTYNGTGPATYLSNSDKTKNISETIEMSDSWDIYITAISTNINETVNLSDDWTIFTNPEQENTPNTITIDDVWNVHLAFEEAIIPDTVTISDSWTINISNPIHFPSAIISHNPLVMITNTSPAQLFQIDISNPASPTWIGYELTGAEYAKDVVYNALTDQYYVACADGIVVQVDATSPNTQSLINLSDTNDLLKISSLDAFNTIYIGTNDADGEVITLEDAEMDEINTHFSFLSQEEYSVSTAFNCIFGKNIDTDFRFLTQNEDSISTDFRYLYADDPANPGSPSPTPYADSMFDMINRTDFVVKIDGVSVTDLQMNSVKITHVVDDFSTAQFVLARKHDRLDYTEAGASSQITNQNVITIYIKDNLEFTGRISAINTNSEVENVTVTARATEKTDNRKTITLPMSSTTEHIHPYHVLLSNPNISNPYMEDDEEDPQYYKGIKVNLGELVEQNWSVFSSTNRTSTAEDIVDGSFKFKQNWSYFWSYVNAKNIISGIQKVYLYIGTSLSQISDDIWDLIGIRETHQRRFDDISLNNYETTKRKIQQENPLLDKDAIEALVEAELWYYEVGDDPKKEITVNNGMLTTKLHYEDRDDGLYSVKDESYNYIGSINKTTGATLTKGYAQTIADLEYTKLLTTAGTVLPKTSCGMELTLDAYYYYNPSLLTRINVSNTTTPNIYNALNGFPVSVKSITINSDDMKLSIVADNSLSVKEIKEIEDTYPDADSDDYITPASARFVLQKSDMKTGEDVE